MKKKLIRFLVRFTLIVATIALLATLIGPGVILSIVRQPEPAESYAYSDVFFEDHLTEGAYVEELAKELHLSRSQLNRFLKEQYGMSFREKLLQTRMDRASWLLRHTEKPVEEIAGEVGYRSESAFFQVFRKIFGQTPEKYRKQHTRGEIMTEE